MDYKTRTLDKMNVDCGKSLWGATGGEIFIFTVLIFLGILQRHIGITG